MPRRAPKPEACDYGQYLTVHPALVQCFGYCFFKAALQYRHRLAKALDRLSLLPPHVGMLMLLDSIGPVNQMKLGDEMGIDKATMVKLIDALEELDVVERVVQSGDRRAKLIRLTERGRRVQASAIGIARRVEKETLAKLTPRERAVMKSAVSKLVTLARKS